MINSVTIVGRTTKEIELRALNNGTSCTSFTIAQNKKVNGQDQTDFFDCVAYGKTAEVLSQYVHKGHRVGISGRLSTRTYQTQQGENRKVVEILVNDFEFLEPRPQQEQYQQPVQQSYQQPVQQGYQQANPYTQYQQPQQGYQQPKQANLFQNQQQMDVGNGYVINRSDLPF